MEILLGTQPLIKQISMISSADPGSIHGGLLALRELASLLDKSDGRKAKVSSHITDYR